METLTILCTKHTSAGSVYGGTILCAKLSMECSVVETLTILYMLSTPLEVAWWKH